MNTKQASTTFVLTCLAFFSGCVSTVRTELAPANRDAIKTTAGYNNLTQAEIGTSINPSNAGGAAGAAGGLIGGLVGGIVDASVNTSRAKKAEAAVTPIRQALIGYDANTSLRDALNATFIDKKTLPIQSFEIIPPANQSAKKTIVASAGADCVLIVTVDHRFTPEFNQIRIVATAELFPKNANLTKSGLDSEGRLYKNDFVSTVGDFAGDRNTIVAAWAADDGIKIKNVLKDGFKEIAEMIAFDLPIGKEANLPNKDSLNTTAPSANANAALGIVALKGVVVHTTEKNRKWVRLVNGSLSATY